MEKEIFEKINAGSACNTAEKVSKVEPIQSLLLPLVAFLFGLYTVAFRTEVVFPVTWM